jgi:hypothetical protein
MNGNKLTSAQVRAILLLTVPCATDPGAPDVEGFADSITICTRCGDVQFDVERQHQANDYTGR